VAATLANPQNEIGFKILQASLDADGVTWSYTPFLVNGVEATVPANATRWTQPAANVGNTAFAVVAYNAAGQSGPSTPFADAIPTAPTTFTAAATAYNAVALSWSGNTTNNSIQILRDAVLINTLPGTATNYVDATVSALTSYNYTINVTNNLGTASATANPSPVTTPMIPVAAPTIVSTVTNTAGTSVALRWTDNANNETAYWVDVTVNGVSTRTVIVSSAAQGIQTNRTLTTNIATAPGSLYTLTVTAVNVTGGGTSKSAPATAVVDLTPPVVSTAPTLTLTSQTSTRANLSWNVVVVPASAVSYVVQVSTNGGAFVDLLTTTQTTTRANVVAGNSYKFQVLAKATRFGLTALGNVSAPALDVTTAPAASAGLQAIAAGTGTSAITLNWTNPSSNIVSWTVARRPNFGLTASRVYSPISVNMQGASPSYTFTDKVPNLGSYTYRVTAVNPQGTSPVATSNAATAQ
jgi:hypothetical protein